MLLQRSSYKDRWMDEEDEVHKHNVILFIKKKKRKCRDDHTKWSRIDRQVSCDITSRLNLKMDTNELLYQRETASQT